MAFQDLQELLFMLNVPKRRNGQRLWDPAGKQIPRGMHVSGSIPIASTNQILRNSLKPLTSNAQLVSPIFGAASSISSSFSAVETFLSFPLVCEIRILTLRF
jgi:hypothetical protein